MTRPRFIVTYLFSAPGSLPQMADLMQGMGKFRTRSVEALETHLIFLSIPLISRSSTPSRPPCRRPPSPGWRRDGGISPKGPEEGHKADPELRTGGCFQSHRPVLNNW